MKHKQYFQVVYKNFNLQTIKSLKIYTTKKLQSKSKFPQNIVLSFRPKKCKLSSFVLLVQID